MKKMCGKQQQDHDNVPDEIKHGEGQKPKPCSRSAVSPLGEWGHGWCHCLWVIRPPKERWKEPCLVFGPSLLTRGVSSLLCSLEHCRVPSQDDWEEESFSCQERTLQLREHLELSFTVCRSRSLTWESQKRCGKQLLAFLWLWLE